MPDAPYGGRLSSGAGVVRDGGHGLSEGEYDALWNHLIDTDALCGDWCNERRGLHKRLTDQVVDTLAPLIARIRDEAVEAAIARHSATNADEGKSVPPEAPKPPEGPSRAREGHL